MALDFSLIESKFGDKLENYVDFASWTMWYPDLFLDLIKRPDGGINLHSDQRVLLRSTTRFFSVYGCFPRGYGKCVAGDTMVFTDKGIIEMGSIFDNNESLIEKTYTLDTSVINMNGQKTAAPLGIYDGYHQTKKITTSDGYTIEGTYVHPLLVMTKSGIIEWKKLKDIAVGDYVVLNRNNNLWGNNLDIAVNDKLLCWSNSLSNSQRSHLTIREMPNTMTVDLAYFLGLLVGDGYLNSDATIGFSNIDCDILSSYRRIASELFGSDVHKNKGNDCDHFIYDTYLRKYLELIGIPVCKAHTKVIPECILRSNKECAYAFVRGLFDTDGTVDNKIVSFTSVSLKLVRQVQMVLLNAGMISRLKTKTDKSGHTSYTLFISGDDVKLFAKEIGFGCQRKNTRLSALVSKNSNTNKDIIPYQRNNVVRHYNHVKQHSTYVRKHIEHLLSGESELSYSKLDYLLGLPDATNSEAYSSLNDLRSKHYYYSEVSSIEDGNAHVYDFHVPETHSFVANGFVNHNTWGEFTSMFLIAIRYPNIELSLTAQTRENSVKLLKDKYYDLIRQYPLLENEVVKVVFTKNDAEIYFKNGARIDALANSQSSKGQRRKRINIEESALLDVVTYEDALEPIVEVPRYTCGKLALVNPEELNQQINFWTTPGWRASDEFERNIDMIADMVDLKGKIVLGSDWRLSCWYGRGSTKNQILAKKRTTSPIAFDQNYGGKWTGSSDNALINISRLMSCRTLTAPMLESSKAGEEFYIAVDVARSQNTNNNQSSIIVGRVNRNADTNRIKTIDIVNVINVPNIYNFTTQASIIKKTFYAYNAKMAIVDGNGLGSGLIDELLKNTIDPTTHEKLGCWNTVNTDNIPEEKNAESCLFDLKAQGIQTRIITTFIDMVDSGKLRLLAKKQEQDFSDKERQDFKRNVLPFVQTDLLFEEISNLKLKHGNNGALSVEKVVRKIDKDRFSALVYLLYYINEYTSVIKPKFDIEQISSLFRFRQPPRHNF